MNTVLLASENITKTDMSTFKHDLLNSELFKAKRLPSALFMANLSDIHNPKKLHARKKNKKLCQTLGQEFFQ